MKNRINDSPDKIPMFFIKKCAISLTMPLTYIFNYAMMTSSLPSIWKMSFVIPIPKKSNPSKADDFRPISLLCPVSKILEKIVFDNLLRHLECNQILPESQHGFRSNHSVTTQLLGVVDDITNAIETKQICDVIYFDFKKAFDTVPHIHLISKLRTFGVEGPILKWLSNYLSDREFSVKVGGKFSSTKKVTSGVPQGSILGPLLFIAYISDLPTYCLINDVSIKLYADDLKAMHISSPNDKFHLPLQMFVNKLSEYANLNGLQLAPNKCLTLHIGPKNPKCHYLLENAPIRNVPENEPVRDLGIYFSKNLKWRSHIEIIVTKSRRTSYALLKSIKSNDPTFLISMFKVYVLPILEFGCPVFNPHYLKDIEQIEKVQRDYVKLVFKRSSEYNKDKTKNPTLAELYAKYELELLELRRLKICLKLFHQFIHENLPLSHNNSFQIVESKTRGET